MIQANPAKAPMSDTVRQSVNQVVHDLATLAELQGLLFQNDAREFAGRIVRPAVVLVAGMLVLLATVPVGLLAIAECLVAAGVPRAVALVLVAVLSAAGAAGMVMWVWRHFQRMPPAFTPSREELKRNIAWIKDAMKNSPSWPRGDAQDPFEKGIYHGSVDYSPDSDPRSGGCRARHDGHSAFPEQ